MWGSGIAFSLGSVILGERQLGMGVAAQVQILAPVSIGNVTLGSVLYLSRPGSSSTK